MRMRLFMVRFVFVIIMSIIIPDAWYHVKGKVPADINYSSFVFNNLVPTMAKKKRNDR